MNIYNLSILFAQTVWVCMNMCNLGLHCSGRQAMYDLGL